MLITLRRASPAVAGLLAAVLTTASYAAAGPAAPDAATIQRADQELQALKEEAIKLNRDVQAIEQAMLYPDQTRSSIYVAVKIGGFLVDEVTVRINENEAVSRRYSDSEARAFLKGDGWHRLLRLRLEPGTYRMQATFSGHFFDAKPTDPPVKGKVETVFEKGLSELDLLLPISRNTRLDKPGLSEVSRLESRKVRPSRNVWMPQPERFETQLSAETHGSLNDPRFRSALFLKEDGRFLSALTELLEIAQTAPDAAALPSDYQLLVAECYLGFGMEKEAERRYQRIAAGDHDPVTLARARLELAKLGYQRGYYAAALDGLNKIRDRLPVSLLDEWKLVTTSTLLAQERYSEAIAILSKGDLNELTPVLRYNLAVALMRDGRETEGRRQLNLVGTMDVANLQMLVLRDKANLTLGYQYLRAQQGESARTVFGRIRTTGPFSNRALLGLGWAEVAPVTAQQAEISAAAEGQNTDDSLGTLLRPGYVDPKANARLSSAAAAAPPATGVTPEEQGALLRALVPWVELAKRDFMDPAVQEGMLAIPWALDRLQDHEQSLARYNEAITALEDARKRMDSAAKSIRGGQMVNTLLKHDADSEKGWKWRLVNLPDTAETYFLQTLLAEHRFQEPLKNLRDAKLLARLLEAWKRRIDELGKAGIASPALDGVRKAHQTWQPAWAGTVVWLELAGSLGAPGAYDAPVSDASPAPMGLQTLQPPAKFEGRLEQLKPLKARIDGLLPQARGIAATEDQVLQAISTRELEGQKATIERYLTEARFAVARIFDRQIKSDR
jgi:tetratricopeptide (TPR) repeat protein